MVLSKNTVHIHICTEPEVFIEDFSPLQLECVRNADSFMHVLQYSSETLKCFELSFGGNPDSLGTY